MNTRPLGILNILLSLTIMACVAMILFDAVPCWVKALKTKKMVEK